MVRHRRFGGGDRVGVHEIMDGVLWSGIGHHCAEVFAPWRVGVDGIKAVLVIPFLIIQTIRLLPEVGGDPSDVLAQIFAGLQTAPWLRSPQALVNTEREVHSRRTRVRRNLWNIVNI